MSALAGAGAGAAEEESGEAKLNRLLVPAEAARLAGALRGHVRKISENEGRASIFKVDFRLGSIQCLMEFHLSARLLRDAAGARVPVRIWARVVVHAKVDHGEESLWAELVDDSRGWPPEAHVDQVARMLWESVAESMLSRFLADGRVAALSEREALRAEVASRQGERAPKRRGAV